MKTKYLRYWILLLAALGLGGCSTVSDLWSDWFGTSAKHDIPAPLVEFKSSVGLSVAGKASVGSAGNAVFLPGQWKGAIFAAGADGNLARFDGALGHETWRVNTQHKLSAGVGVGPTLVVVATSKGEVLAYDHNGKAMWQARCPAKCWRRPP